MRHNYLGILVLLGSMLMLLSTSTPYERDWTLKRTGEELWVYTRDKQGSEIKEVRLVMEVDASIEQINDVLNDASRQPEWVFHCSEASDLGGDINTTGWYYYSRIALPWPMDDRDLVAKVVGGQEGNLYSSSSVAAPNHQPEVEGCVRITKFEVETTYEVLPNGGTKINYEVHSEPGGAVPNWLVNMFVDKGPVETLTKLRKLVEAKK